MDNSDFTSTASAFLRSVGVRLPADQAATDQTGAILGSLLAVASTMANEFIAAKDRGVQANMAMDEVVTGLSRTAGSRLLAAEQLVQLANLPLLDEAESHPDNLPLQAAAQASVALTGLLPFINGYPNDSPVSAWDQILQVAQAATMLHQSVTTIATGQPPD